MSWPSDSIVSCEQLKNQSNPGVRGCALFCISGNPHFHSCWCHWALLFYSCSSLSIPMDLQISLILWRSFEQLQLLLRWPIQSPVWIWDYLFIYLFISVARISKCKIEPEMVPRLKIIFSRDHSRDVVGAGGGKIGCVHTMIPLLKKWQQWRQTLAQYLQEGQDSTVATSSELKVCLERLYFSICSLH